VSGRLHSRAARTSSSARCSSGSGRSTSWRLRPHRPRREGPSCTPSSSTSSTCPPTSAPLPPHWRPCAEPRGRALVDRRSQRSLALIEDGSGLDEATWFTEAAALVERWFSLEDPTALEPAERELYVEHDLDGLLLRGYVDRLDVAPDGSMRVVDYKTGRSPAEAFEGKALFQMKFYALVLWRTRGEVPRLLQLVYLGNGEIVRYCPTSRSSLPLERNLKAVWAAVVSAPRDRRLAPPHLKLCNWCDYPRPLPGVGRHTPSRCPPTPRPGPPILKLLGAQSPRTTEVLRGAAR
jgi:putative RecB family exonuclease